MGVERSGRGSSGFEPTRVGGDKQPAPIARAPTGGGIEASRKLEQRILTRDIDS